jgi:hypothetical protein
MKVDDGLVNHGPYELQLHKMEKGELKLNSRLEKGKKRAMKHHY